MVVWKCCHYFQSTLLSMMTSFSPSPWDAHDPCQLLRAQLLQQVPVLWSSSFPQTAWVMSCSGLCHRKWSVLMFAGTKLLLNYFKWSRFVVNGVRNSHQALPPLYTVNVCSYTLPCHGKDSYVASILSRVICHLCLASHTHSSRRKCRILGANNNQN